MKAVSLALLAIIPLSSYANNELTQPNSPMPASEQYQQQYQQHHQAASGGHYAKNFNVRFLGSGIFNEFIGASIDFQINAAMTAGPMAKGFISNSNSGYLVGFDAIYATNGNVFSTGWIISPYVGFTSSDYKQTTKKSSAVIGTNMGYQWMFSGNFNTQLGVGGYFSSTPIPMTISEKGNFFPSVMASVGYSF